MEDTTELYQPLLFFTSQDYDYVAVPIKQWRDTWNSMPTSQRVVHLDNPVYLKLGWITMALLGNNKILASYGDTPERFIEEVKGLGLIRTF